MGNGMSEMMSSEENKEIKTSNVISLVVELVNLSIKKIENDIENLKVRIVALESKDGDIEDEEKEVENNEEENEDVELNVKGRLLIYENFGNERHIDSCLTDTLEILKLEPDYDVDHGLIDFLDYILSDIKNGLINKEEFIKIFETVTDLKIKRCIKKIEDDDEYFIHYYNNNKFDETSLKLLKFVKDFDYDGDFWIKRD
jgi:hypothetical protein